MSDANAPPAVAGPRIAPRAIAVEDLVKSYDGARVLDGVTVSVAAGSLCALLGPNGAGKTTLSECISGFRRPDSGQVRVLGHNPLTERHRVAEVLGVMLQEGGAYPSATPREMLELFTGFHSRSETPAALLDLVGLRARADTRYRRLSGGQKQRLNLALALVGRPRVLVLDEPTAAMDPKARDSTWALLRRLRADGVAVLFATHDLREAERLADRVLVIDRGRIVADDSPSRLAAASSDGGVLVTTPAAIDARDLARAVGADVRPDGDGRWIVAAPAVSIPAITTWFDRRRIPLTGVTATGADLESVFAKLTAPDDVAADPATAREAPSQRSVV